MFGKNIKKILVILVAMMMLTACKMTEEDIDIDLPVCGGLRICY